MHPLRISIVASLLASPLLFAACGGAVSSPSGGSQSGEPSQPASTSSGSPSASGGEPGISPPGQPTSPGSAPASTTNPNSGPHAPPCLDPMPADGTQCSSPGTTCEYGGASPMSLCTTLVRCGSDDNSSATTWHVTPPDPSCVSAPAQNAAACPSSFDALMNGAVCPLKAECVYPEGACSCTSCADQNSTTASTQWKCSGFAGPIDGCPASRPLIGTACSQEAMQCSYGTPCDPVLDWNPMECKNGAWAVSPHGEDCSQQACIGH